MKNEPQDEFEQIFHLYVKHFTCDALHNLVPFVQLKKPEKNMHGGVLLLVQLQAKSLQLLKVTLLHGCFLHFLNCTNGTKTSNMNF